MNEIEDGGPAFPTDQSPSQEYTDIKGGMSLRDWFAGMAMQGMMNSSAFNGASDEILAGYAFKHGVRHA